MKTEPVWFENSPIGPCQSDRQGSPVGVARLEPGRSYAGVGKLLQRFINDADDAAWKEIRDKIDYTYEGLNIALTALEAETGFGLEIKNRIEIGQKLFFKPNLVSLNCIHAQTHGPDTGSTACTEWPLAAALMRWFHDSLGISYYRMALGEAATLMPSLAKFYTVINPEGRPVTPEAAIEGRTGNFYAGWGFYFVRKYLSDSLPSGSDEDPMRGYEESCSGFYIPPGQVRERLMVYDLNRLSDDPAKGRVIKVPDGVNFSCITLHKVIVGGDPGDPLDRENYPGCVLINIPKLKVHSIALFTNAIKNLGIGLYPMQWAGKGGCAWDYSAPHVPAPGAKSGVPHEVWVPELDPETGLPRLDPSGRSLVRKSGGLTATMIDIIQAVKSAGTYMIHVVDAIEMINLDHQGIGMGEKMPEGMIFAGLDPVATDLLCARYLFSNVPFQEALASGLEDGAGGMFPQSVPLPRVREGQIHTGQGFDSPVSRDRCFEEAEKRGLGIRQYFVIGRDLVNDAPLVSLQGHLGMSKDGIFFDLVTTTLYFDVFKVPWDLQRTFLGYLAAVDELTGSSHKSKFLETFDEDGDGIVTYEETGRKGIWGTILDALAFSVSLMGAGLTGPPKARFYMNARMLKYADPARNAEGSDLLREYAMGMACLTAMKMSQLPFESPDLFQPSLFWGNGKWPSLQMASYIFNGFTLYGQDFPFQIKMASLYGTVLSYVDLTRNNSQLTGPVYNRPDPQSITRYFSAVNSGEIKPLDFTLFVPPGYENIAGSRIPNVEVTLDPALIFTARFAGGKEVWAGSGR